MYMYIYIYKHTHTSPQVLRVSSWHSSGSMAKSKRRTVNVEMHIRNMLKNACARQAVLDE